MTTRGASIVYTYRWYIKDHLGSNCAVMDASGNLSNCKSYYPYGREMDMPPYANGSVPFEGIVPSGSSFSFSSKEFVTQGNINWYDFGARWYDPYKIRWTTQDPLAEKYYGISPYVYCAANPVNLVDPEGKKIYIRYTDEHGKDLDYCYEIGAKYFGRDDFVQNVVDALNNIYSNGGQDVIGALVDSPDAYTYLNEVYKYGNYAVNGYNDGYIYLGNTFNGGMDVASKLESVAHESFHAFQDYMGQGGISAFNEVEANVFAGRIQFNYAMNDYSGFAGAPATRGTSSMLGKLYASSMNRLLYENDFNHLAFYWAITLFAMASDTGGLYKNYPIYSLSNRKILVNKYWPTLKE